MTLRPLHSSSLLLQRGPQGTFASSRLALRDIKSPRPGLRRQWHSNARFTTRNHKTWSLRTSATGRRPYQPLPPCHQSLSTISPATAVHASQDIPEGAKRLHAALKKLQQDASSYIDVSQLRLALRSLESENAITRLAILGVEDHVGARRLARVLLADPLNAEAEWEKQLIEYDSSDGRALLLRYNKHVSTDESHPLVKTLFVPSNTLLNHQLEIFIQTITENEYASGSDTADPLVPSLQTKFASSLGVNPSTITYPVNKSLMYCKDLGYVGSLPRSSREESRSQRQLTYAVVDGNWSDLSTSHDPARSAAASPINVALAESAIQTIRSSMANSFSYEHAWYDSGLPAVSNWILSGTTSSSPQSVKATVLDLTRAMTSSTEAVVADAEVSAEQEARSKSLPPANRLALVKAIDTWSEGAHAELQQSLNVAFHSKRWNRLAWWKLPLFADDITLNLNALVTDAWLPNTERGLFYLSGRLTQAGLRDISDIMVEDATGDASKDAFEGQNLDATSPFSKPSERRLDELQPESLTSAQDPKETQQGPMYDHEITITRQKIAEYSIPHLQSMANKFVLQAWSTTLLSTGLSALLYVSISTTSVYEASAVAAAGTVWSLRRLQRKWEDERSTWRFFLWDEGVDVLRQLDAKLRRLVSEGGYVRADEIGVQERQRARKALEVVKMELDKIEGKEGT